MAGSLRSGAVDLHMLAEPARGRGSASLSLSPPPPPPPPPPFFFFFFFTQPRRQTKPSNRTWPASGWVAARRATRPRSPPDDGVREAAANRPSRRCTPGDPKATGEAVLTLVDADEPPLRVFFGRGPAGDRDRRRRVPARRPGTSGSPSRWAAHGSLNDPGGPPPRRGRPAAGSRRLSGVVGAGLGVDVRRGQDRAGERTPDAVRRPALDLGGALMPCWRSPARVGRRGTPGRRTPC